MKTGLLAICTFILLLACFALHAQNSQNLLLQARELAYSKQFSKADSILTEYNQSNTDVNGIRLHAQVAWWMGDATRAKAILTIGMEALPNNPYLALDYGKLLFETGKPFAAQPYLEAYEKIAPGNSEVLYMLANCQWWRGDLREAMATADTLLASHPNDEKAVRLRKEISATGAPYVELGYQFNSDDQPMKVHLGTLEAGVFRSKWLAPFISVKANSMQTKVSNQSMHALAGNKFSFGASGTTLTLAGGVMSQNGQSNFIGKALLAQKLVPHLYADIGWERRAYQYTELSTLNPLIQDFVQGALRFNKKDLWIGKAAFEQQIFDDNHKVTTLYAWGMIPFYKSPKFIISGGYAFTYADADTNTFRPDVTFNEIIARGFPVKSIYDPYFTPENQVVHAALVSIRFPISENFQVALNGDYGFSGKADNPYFYLDRDNGNKLIIRKAFYEESYHPVNIKADIKTSLSRSVGLSLYYQYSKLFFYTNHMGGVRLKINFVNEPK